MRRSLTGLRFSTLILAIALLFALVAGACRLGGSTSDRSGALADRLLRLGEDADAKLEVREGQLPQGLQEVLNPGSSSKTPKSELISIPTHPDGKLLGSFRLERPDGTVTYFVLYDVNGKPQDIEGAVAKQVNASPWQTIGGQSNDSVALLRFQSTVSSDITGTVAIQPGPTEGGKALTSLVYIIQVEPSAPPLASPFTLPAARALPEGFPAELALPGATPVQVQWAVVPQGRTYQVRFLTKQSSLDATDGYRSAFQGAGWKVVSDQAQGFATELAFEKDSGNSQASVSVDTYKEDESYTEILFSLQLAR